MDFLVSCPVNLWTYLTVDQLPREVHGIMLEAGSADQTGERRVLLF